MDGTVTVVKSVSRDLSGNTFGGVSLFVDLNKLFRSVMILYRYTTIANHILQS